MKYLINYRKENKTFFSKTKYNYFVIIEILL